MSQREFQHVCVCSCTYKVYIIVYIPLYTASAALAWDTKMTSTPVQSPCGCSHYACLQLYTRPVERVELALPFADRTSQKGRSPVQRIMPLVGIHVRRSFGPFDYLT